MNVFDLGAKCGNEARARRRSEVAHDTERFVKTVESWTHYNEFGSHKYKVYPEGYLTYVSKPYCLYLRTRETDPAAIENITAKYTNLGFKCQLSRDKSRYMISSEYIKKQILDANYSDNRDIFIPDIEDAAREFYDKHRALLTKFKVQLGSGPMADMHTKLWEISSKINDMGHVLVEDKDNGRAQQRIENIMNELNPICTSFCRLAYALTGKSNLGDRFAMIASATSFTFWPTFDYIGAIYRRARM